MKIQLMIFFILFSLFLFINSTKADIITGLVGHWTFNEGTDTVANDSSGNNNHGTVVNGAVWTAGRIGQALDFDGVNDYVNSGASSTLAPTNALTLSAWIKPRSVTTTQFIINKAVGRAANGDYFLVLRNTGVVGIVVNTGTEVVRNGNTVLSANNWYHVVGVWDGSNLQVYLNGVSDSATQSLSGTMANNGDNLGIGASATGNHPFNGAIDDVRVYTRALSASDVLELYNSAPDITPPTVSTTSPVSGSTVSGTIAVSANASDNVGVAGVQFLLDGANLGAEDTTAPYSISWDTTAISDGLHTLTSRASDTSNNTATSAAVTVTVSNIVDITPPNTSITSPASGSNVSGTITVSANASDDIGVVGVQFLLDGANLGAEDTTFPYSVSWDTTAAANGSHTLTAVARDAAGNNATSDVVNVTVNKIASISGNWTVLVLQPSWGSISTSRLNSMISRLSSFWNANSYEKVTLTPTIASGLQMPQTQSYYSNGIASSNPNITHATLMADALLAAKAAGYNIEQYDFHLVIPATKNIGVHGGKVWLRSVSGTYLLAMEFGHSLQSSHANAWSSSSIIGPGTKVEYGNPFDNLGGGRSAGSAGHYNTRMKHRLGWLTDNDITTVTQSGTYRIQPHDQPLAAGSKAALRIKLDNDRNYWVEFRSLFSSTENGALIMWGYNDWQYYNPEFAPPQSLLLDMTPSTLGTFTDAALLINQTFTDSSAGITIKVLGKGNTTPETLDIQVNLTTVPSPIDVTPKISFVNPVDDVGIFSGNVTFEITTYDLDIGTANGDGISNVVFEIYNTKSEPPVLVSPLLSSPPYSWTLNTESLADSGYVLLARVNSTQAAGGHFNTLGTFFIVDNT